MENFKIIGHQKQWQFLKESAKLGKIPHAFLFSGPSQIGKKTLALEFVKLINCQEKDFNSRPCQECRSCKDIKKKIHPDLVIIEPEENKIHISQIRELRSHLSLRPYLASFKTVIIDQAHCLNQEAQSAFLKTLEEPKGKCCFFLISEYPEALLPTILSRTEKVKFYPVDFSKIENHFKNQGIKGEKIKEIALFSFGKPGKAINFLLDPQKIEIQNQRIKEISKLISSDFSFRFQYAKDLSDNPEKIKDVLEIWLRYFRNVLIAKVKKLKTQNQFDNYSVSKLKNIIKIIQEIDYLISTTNVNQRLALEILMLEL